MVHASYDNGHEWCVYQPLRYGLDGGPRCLWPRRRNITLLLLLTSRGMCYVVGVDVGAGGDSYTTCYPCGVLTAYSLLTMRHR